MTYALLIYRLDPAAVPIPAAVDERGLAEHKALQAQTVAEGDLHAVARLTVPEGAKTVRVRPGGHDVTDGPFLETKEWLVGFYLVDCDDEAEALARAERITVPHHAVEVRKVDWRWKG